MKHVVLAVFLAAIAVGYFVSQPALADNSAAAEEAEGYVVAYCPDRSEKDCEHAGQEFVDEYVRAMHGDYQAQRNVAYTLSGRDAGAAVFPNFVQGCAWRLVIVMSGDARAGEGDASNLKLECGRISEADRVIAEHRSAAILEQIEMNKMSENR